MSTKLCIQVSSALQPQKLEVEFIYNEAWTADSELILLQRLHEILSVIRENGTSIKLSLDVDVKNPSEAMFQIKKKTPTQSAHDQKSQTKYPRNRNTRAYHAWLHQS